MIKSTCINWIFSKNKKGYGTICKTLYGERFWLAHRYAYRKYIGEIPEGMCVLHKCDNPGCVNPKHLWIGTDLDNARDRNSKGRQADRRGENNIKAKFTNEQVLKIRELYKTKEYSHRGLARMFEVTRSTITNILTSKTWLHI